MGKSVSRGDIIDADPGLSPTLLEKFPSPVFIVQQPSFAIVQGKKPRDATSRFSLPTGVYYSKLVKKRPSNPL
jgi:hypothetical protein